jgi:hypothetical protein
VFTVAPHCLVNHGLMRLNRFISLIYSELWNEFFINNLCLIFLISMKSSDVTGVNIWNLRMPNAMRDFCEKKSNIGRWIYVIQERYMHTIVVDCIYIYWDSVVHGESWARVCVAKWNQGIPVGYGLWEGGGCHAWLVALQQAIRRKRRHTGPISHPSSCLAAPALPITEVLAALARYEWPGA